MVRRVKTPWNYNYKDYVVTPDTSIVETVPDMNLSIKQIVNDFLRENRGRELTIDVKDKFEDSYIDPANEYFDDPLTALSSEFETSNNLINDYRNGTGKFARKEETD